MYQTGFPSNVGRRRSKNVERMAEVFRAHYAEQEPKPNSVSDKPNSVIPKKRGRPRKADK